MISYHNFTYFSKKTYTQNLFELLTIKLFAVFLRFCMQMGIFRDRHNASGKFDFQALAAEFTEIWKTVFDGLCLNSISFENLCHVEGLIA